MFIDGLAQSDNNLDNGNSILWVISKNGLKQKSYLLGTYHGGTTNSISYSYIDSLPQFKRILDEVDAIGVECDFTDTTFLKMVADNINNCVFKRYPADSFLPDSISDISQLFNDTIEYEIVCSLMQDFKKMRFPIADDYNKLKPVFTIQMINQFVQILRDVVNKKKGVVFISMDVGIQEEARRLGKRVFYMESAEYHTNLLNKIKTTAINSQTLQEQAHSLYLFCKEFKAGSKDMESYEKRLQELYIKGDLNSALNLEETTFYDLKQRSDFSAMDKEVSVGRNQDWVPIITSNIETGSCLIAVGAMHLPGESGLIYLLKEQGYEVNPINLFER